MVLYSDELVDAVKGEWSGTAPYRGWTITTAPPSMEDWIGYRREENDAGADQTTWEKNGYRRHGREAGMGVVANLAFARAIAALTPAVPEGFQRLPNGDLRFGNKCPCGEARCGRWTVAAQEVQRAYKTIRPEFACEENLERWETRKVRKDVAAEIRIIAADVNALIARMETIEKAASHETRRRELMWRDIQGAADEARSALRAVRAMTSYSVVDSSLSPKMFVGAKGHPVPIKARPVCSVCFGPATVESGHLGEGTHWLCATHARSGLAAWHRRQTFLVLRRKAAIVLVTTGIAAGLSYLAAWLLS